MKRALRIPGLALTSICLMLAACIYVDDFGEYWDKAVFDPFLAGKWQGQDCVEFKPSGKEYSFTSDGDPVPARTLVAGKTTFLMVKPPKDRGYMFKYVASKDTMTLYTPNDGKRDAFIREFGNDNIVIKDDTVTIKKLDKQAVEMLTRIGAQPDYWKATSSYKHADCTPERKTDTPK